MLIRVTNIKFRSINPELFISHKRFYAYKLEKVKKKFTHTIQLPKTKFPHWFNAQKRIELDELILKTCGFSELYAWQRENVKGAEFVLHDGPPYANGTPHMGHAINKIMKDIVIRSKLLSGNKIHYKPGWDCHGLPIELKALLKDQQFKNLTPLEIRSKARKFAKGTITDQKSVFRSWGIMADWDNGCYHTFDNSYIKNQLQQFYHLYEKGFIYRDVKPVHWSPSTRTALAEAELEYKPDHKSRSIIMKCKLRNCAHHILERIGNRDTYALIWTTTPWTIPANQAIAYNNDFTYCLVQFNHDDSCYYIIAENLIEQLEGKLNKTVEVITSFRGSDLAYSTYVHPLNELELPFLPGDHVTSDVGTGLVHTAPAHGSEDFLMALNHEMNIVCLVDEEGCYTAEAGTELNGLPVLNEGTSKVIKMLKNHILKEETIVHSYPYDWRSKKPIILRASKQWFIDTDIIKEKALQALNNVKVIPEKFVQNLIIQTDKRPYWCISRQRSWGVPVPALYCLEDVPVVNKDLIDHYCDLIEKHGTDFWWTLSLEKLVPEKLHNVLPMDKLTKGEDIIDIWFDSGLSWSAVLENKQADLYVEGIDQLTGWFQSSLLTSVALQDKAPYKNILVHGFALDEHGNKMSKSIGNVVNPQEICLGGTDFKKNPPYGVDTLRWWVAAHAANHSNVLVSKATLGESSESIKKLRNVLKFLLGVLHDLPVESIRVPPPLTLIDQFIIYSLKNYKSMVYQHYDNYQFHKVSSAIINFVTNQLSAFYCHTTKDRLYCDEPESASRRAVQYTMWHALNVLTQTFAPIAPFLAEETFSHHPHSAGIPFFYQHFKEINLKQLRTESEIEKIMDVGFKVREMFNKECPVNVKPQQLKCFINAGPKVLPVLKELNKAEISPNSDLVNLLQASQVELLLDPNQTNFGIKIQLSDLHFCERCRRYNSNTEGETCARCSQALNVYT